MLGSIDEFIDTQYDFINNKLFEWGKEELSLSAKLHNTNNFLESRKRRTFSGVESYKPEDKEWMIDKFNKGISQRSSFKNKAPTDKPNCYLFRKPITSRGGTSSLFYSEKPLCMKDSVNKEKLRREHNLLRAIERTKAQNEEKTTTTEYENSLNRVIKGFNSLKTSSLDKKERQNETKQNKISRIDMIANYTKNKPELKNQTRLEFENCLSWSKKRKKDGSFYATKLGKNNRVEKNKETIENRKEMLEFLRDRASSLGV